MRSNCWSRLILGSIFLGIVGGCADKPLPISPGIDSATGGSGGSEESISSGSVSGLDGSNSATQGFGGGSSRSGGLGQFNSGSSGIQEDEMSSSKSANSLSDRLDSNQSDENGQNRSGKGGNAGGLGDFLSGKLHGDGSISDGSDGNAPFNDLKRSDGSIDASNPRIASMIPFHTTSNLSDVFFDYDKHDLTEQSKSVLQNNAEWLKNNPNVLVQIQGHCDERGTNNYNLALGERRAQSTKNFLVLLGISKNRINAMTYGEEKPFCVASMEQCWSQNRRGHFMVSK